MESNSTTETMPRNQTRPKYATVIDADNVRIDKKPFGDVGSVDEGALAAFLQSVWMAPGDWHRLPGPKTTLAIRAVPDMRAAGTTCFELRCDSSPEKLRRYEYDSSTDFLTCWINRQTSHSGITSNHGIPTGPEQFALMVSAFLRVDYDSRSPDNIPRSVNTSSGDLRAEPPAFAPLPSAIANIIDRIAHQWFNSTSYTWNLIKRVLIALAGSLTFFGTFFAYVVLDPDSKREWLRILHSGEDTFPVLIPLILVIVAIWFAWLNGYKNLGHGAIRLYLGGFLLPYLVWALISVMPGMGEEVRRLPDGLSSAVSEDASREVAE